MKRFDITRFGHTLRWSLTMDRGWFLRTTLSWTVMLTLMFLLFTCFTFIVKDDGHTGYEVSTVLFVATVVAILLLGPSFMFVSMTNRHADQTLLMLPASNLEKYLARYSYWLLSLPCLAVAFLTADLLQFVVNTLTGNDNATLVMSIIVEVWGRIPDDVPREEGLTSLLFALWLHSFYALGATFFRAHKYNYVLTSVVLVLVLMLTGIMQGKIVIDELLYHHRCYCNWTLLGLSVFNFWLSYRLFRRTQVIGKFINI
ncbi:MAG: hypothetical protein K2M96_03255 [Prevotella sp.]|nr:hypothetical protein [Prevotella sp.]